MRLSTSVLLVSWIPLIQLLLLHFHSNRVWDINVYIFLPLSILLSFTGMWLLVKKLRTKVDPYKLMTNFFLLLFLFIILFGIPVFAVFAKLFEIDSDILHDPHPTAGFIICISVAVLSWSALVLAWREARKEKKPYLPVLKFILASVFMIWQLNLGFHFYVRMHSFISGNGYYHSIGELMRLSTPRQIFSIVYITLNIIFFSDLLLRRKVKNGQDLLLLPGAGLLMLSGTYTLIPLMVIAVKQLPATVNISLFMVTSSFITIIGPILILAIILTIFGAILALYKGIRHLRITASLLKGVIVSAITIILYLLLFNSFWPIRDPSMNVLIRIMKENKKVSWDGLSHHGIAYGCFCEIISFGKGARGFIIEKLMDNEVIVRRNSAFILEFVGDQRAVPPLLAALKDRDEGVRGNAASSLGWIRDRRAIIPLINTLNDEASYVVEKGAAALSFFKDARAVEALIEKLKENISDNMKNKINKSLTMITNEYHEGKPETMWEWWQEWWEKNKKKFIKQKRRAK